MKRLSIIFASFLTGLLMANAYTVYYYYGQYFKPTSANTVALIAPVMDGDATRVSKYKDSFDVQSIIIGGKTAYKVTGIAPYAFNGSSITLLNLGESVDSVGYRACYSCKTLTAVANNEGLRKIGDEAFYNCTNLTSFNLPNTIVEIGQSALARCALEGNLQIPSSVERIMPYGIFGTNISSVKFSSSTLYFGTYAFGQSTYLDNVDVASLTDWCNYQFEDEYANPLYFAKTLTVNGETIHVLNLTDEKIMSIPVGAFCGQTTIKSVMLGSNVQAINHKSFYASSIDTIFIEATIPPTIEDDSFSSTTYRHAILVVPDGTKTAYESAWHSFAKIKEKSQLLCGVKDVTMSQGLHIFNCKLTCDEPMHITIVDMNGRVLLDSITQVYKFPYPGVYIINGKKLTIN